MQTITDLSYCYFWRAQREGGVRVCFLAVTAIGLAFAAQTEARTRALAASEFAIQGEAGFPYAAEEVSETVQTLADGTHITQSNGTTKLYRDFEGRARREHIFPLPPDAVNSSTPPVLVIIFDPVAGFNITLNERNHKATRVAIRQRQVAARSATGTNASQLNVDVGTTKFFTGGNAAQTAEPVKPNRPLIVREKLGTQTIEGVTAEGSRISTTYPEGSVGNDRPFTVVEEHWISHELGLTVLSKNSDPRRGESTTKLINISRSEPDPALFQVPADYTIEDQPQRN